MTIYIVYVAYVLGIIIFLSRRWYHLIKVVDARLGYDVVMFPKRPFLKRPMKHYDSRTIKHMKRRASHHEDINREQCYVQYQKTADFMWWNGVVYSTMFLAVISSLVHVAIAILMIFSLAPTLILTINSVFLAASTVIAYWYGSRQYNKRFGDELEVSEPKVDYILYK